jgi:NNP family nitrate/nitrite transporter-like MFS transporter
MSAVPPSSRYCAGDRKPVPLARARACRRFGQTDLIDVVDDNCCRYCSHRMTSPPPSPPQGAYRALAVAALAFATNFWAWGLISPLAPAFTDLLTLDPLRVSVMVATPVLLGAIARVPLGAMTDRFGGRTMFIALSLIVTIPLVALAFFQTFPALLLGGLVLGLAGASFAIGVPFVNAWFPPARRGFALGVYGAGNIGTALAGFTAPTLFDQVGTASPFLLAAGMMLATALVVALFARDAPTTGGAKATMVEGMRAALGLRITFDLAAMYALTFGGFVAFGVYLPTYLRSTYDLTPADAGARAAGFIVLATLARPVGGWLSDRIGSPKVLGVSLAIVAAGAAVVAFAPPLFIATAPFLAIAASLGLGNGAVFALVGRGVPAERVGAVTGFVGAAGGLGGFVPPLVMGSVYASTGSYLIGLLLLAAVSAAALWHSLRRFGFHRRPAESA